MKELSWTYKVRRYNTKQADLREAAKYRRPVKFIAHSSLPSAGRPIKTAIVPKSRRQIDRHSGQIDRPETLTKDDETLVASSTIPARHSIWPNLRCHHVKYVFCTCASNLTGPRRDEEPCDAFLAGTK
jgi:hypothetical protein